jgi:sugar phosphate isomerase/epimerase
MNISDFPRSALVLDSFLGNSDLLIGHFPRRPRSGAVAMTGIQYPPETTEHPRFFLCARTWESYNRQRSSSYMNRRDFVKLGAAAASALPFMERDALGAMFWKGEPFKISLAEWSLNRSIKSGKLTNLDFPLLAKKEFGIDCIEFVDQFFADKGKDRKYLQRLKAACDDNGLRVNLIMVDTNGKLGAADKKERATAVENTYQWIDATKFLGGGTVRVNAHGDGNADELRSHVAESCAKLADYAAKQADKGQPGINLCIENHGNLSSDPEWLISLVKAVNKPNFGTLPDFGNFPDELNHYDAVEKLMPYAKAVSAKTRRFSDYGMVEDVDLFRMMRVVRDGGYSGYVGIESVPAEEKDEYKAIKDTATVLRWVKEEQFKCVPIFSGKDLTGWKQVEGGEWVIENGVIIGRNGVNWSTNPEKSGSWLSTRRQYADFRLELQYAINKGGNSGILFRSTLEKNPAFTGYELQILDGTDREPNNHNVGSLYDLVAPQKVVARSPGEWNSVSIETHGPKIRVTMNGEKILETEQDRSMRGYIGFQNHDSKSEVRFKNIRLEEL